MLVSLGRERLLPVVLSDADADTGIARVAPSTAALPFSLRSFAQLGVAPVECPSESLHFLADWSFSLNLRANVFMSGN